MNEIQKKKLITELVAYRHRLVRYAQAVIKNQNFVAEDLAHDTILLALISLHRFDPTRGTTFEAWLFTILKHRYLAIRKRKWRTCEIEPVDGNEHRVVTTWSAEDGVILSSALNKLKARNRDALLCVLAYGQEYADVSQEMGVRESTIKTWVNEARAQIAAEMDVKLYKKPVNTAQVAASRRNGAATAQRWIVTCPDGHEEEVVSLRQFCLKHGLTMSNIVRVSSKGFKARKAEQNGRTESASESRAVGIFG